MSSRETLITSFFGLRERFTRKGGLVNGNIDSLSETTISGNDVADFERNHVSGDEDRGFKFTPGSVTSDFGFGCKGIHKSLDSVTGVAFFVETDGGINEQ
jgi:hypothetical protein